MDAALAVEGARMQIATVGGVDPQEIVFTSGATEANNIALLGLARAAKAIGEGRRRLAISAIEHKSVLAAAESLRKEGFVIDILPVTQAGIVDLASARLLIGSETLVVSVMAANNETGLVQPVEAVTDIAHRAGAIMHVDAAQAFGKLPLELWRFDMASLSAHKLYGPMGVGALYVSAAAPLRPAPLVFGGGQEGGLRPGTVPTPLIVGFGAAACLAQARMTADAAHGRALTAAFLDRIEALMPNWRRRAEGEDTIPGSLNIEFIGVDSDELIQRVSNTVCLSNGSACSAGQMDMSHVFRAMNIPETESASTVRLFFGRHNTVDEINFAAGEIASAVRDMTAAWTSRPGPR